MTRLGAGAANDLDWLIVCIEDLNPAIAEFADVLPPGPVHANIVGITQLAFAAPGLSIGAQEFAVPIENLDAMIAGVRDIDPILRIYADAFRPIKIARGVARLELGFPARSVSFCDILERQIAPATLRDAAIDVPYSPFKILTLKVRRD